MGTLIFFLVDVSIVVLALAIMLHAKRRRKAEDESINEAIRQVLNRHKGTLALKAEQLKCLDAYGGLDGAAWEREKKYFIDHYLFQYVGTSSYRQLLISNQIDVFVESLPKPRRSSARDVVPGDGIGYEKYCADRLKEHGWQVRLTKASGDQGVDIIATKSSKKVVIQCKNHSKPVGNKAVQEIHAGMVYEKAEVAIVVSRKGFTPSARRLAKSANVYLIDDSQLSELDEVLAR